MAESQPLLSNRDTTSRTDGSHTGADVSSTVESINTDRIKDVIGSRRSSVSTTGRSSLSKKDSASKSTVRFDDIKAPPDNSSSPSPSPPSSSSTSSSRPYGSNDDSTPLFWSIHAAKQGGRRWLRRAKTSTLPRLSDGDKAASDATPVSDAINNSMNLAHTTINGVEYQPLELAAGGINKKTRHHHTRIGAKLSQIFHPDEIHTIMGSKDEHKDPSGGSYHSLVIHPDGDDSNDVSNPSSSHVSPGHRHERSLSRLSSGFNTPSYASSPTRTSTSSSSYSYSSSWRCTRWICSRIHSNKAQQIFEGLTDPAGEYRRFWLLLIFLFLLYNAISVSWRLAFNDIWLDIHTVIILTCIDYLGDLFFLLDVGLNFYTPYINQGMLERDIREIQAHYLRAWFIPDLCASFPIDILFLHNGLRAALPLRLTRLLRFAKYDQYFSVWEQYSTRYPQFIRFFKLLLSILLILHWLACLWFWCGYYYGFGNTQWLPATGIDETSLASQYIFAFWWATNIVTQVGGDPGLPTNDIERALDLSIAFLSVFVVAVVIGNVNELVSELNADEGRLREKLQTLNHFMVTRRLPEELQSRIRSYYLKIWIRRGGVDDAAIMEELPTSLRTEISLVMNKDILGKVPIFAGSSQGFMHSLVGHLKLQTYGPGEMIVREDDVGSEMYFVSRGQVNVLKGGKLVGKITAGGVFGEIAVLQESAKRTASIQAVNYCDLFVLTHEDMKTLFKSFPSEKQIILNVAETRKAKDLLMKTLNDEKLLRREKLAGFTRDPKLVAQLIDLFKPIALGAGALHDDHDHMRDIDNDTENIDSGSAADKTNNLLRESGLIEGEHGELIDLEELENRGLIFGPFQPADTLHFIGKGAVDILPNLNNSSPPLRDDNIAAEALLEEEEQRVVCRLHEGSFFGCITDGDYQVSAVIAKEHRCDTIIFAFNAADLPALQSYYESIENPKDKHRVRRSLTALFTRYRTEEDYKNSITPLSTPASRTTSIRSTPTQKSLHQLIRTVSKTARLSRRNSLGGSLGEIPSLTLAAGTPQTQTTEGGQELKEQPTETETATSMKQTTTTTTIQENQTDEADDEWKDTANQSVVSQINTATSTQTAPSTSSAPVAAAATGSIAPITSPTIITISEATETTKEKETTITEPSAAAATNARTRGGTTISSSITTPTAAPIQSIPNGPITTPADAASTTIASPPPPATTTTTTTSTTSSDARGVTRSTSSPNYYSPLADDSSPTTPAQPNFNAGRPRSLTHLLAAHTRDTEENADRIRRPTGRSNSLSGGSPNQVTGPEQPVRGSSYDHLSPEPLSATTPITAIDGSAVINRERKSSYNLPSSTGGAAPFAFLLKMNQGAHNTNNTTPVLSTSPRGSTSPSPSPQPADRSSPNSPLPDQELQSPSPTPPSTHTYTKQPVSGSTSPNVYGQSAMIRSSVSGTGSANVPSARMLFLEKALNDLTNDQLLLLCNKATLKLYSRLHATNINPITA